MLQWQPFIVTPLLSAVICAIVGWSARRQRRSAPAAPALALLMLGLTAWSAAEAIGWSFASLTVQRVFDAVIYPVATVSAFGAFLLCRKIVDRNATLSRTAWILFAIEPVVMAVAAATNGWHHLVVDSAQLVGRPGVMVAQPGTLFWLHSIYNYALLVAALYRVVRARRSSTGLYRRQLTTVLVGCGAPVVGNLLPLALPTGGNPIDTAVIGFVVAGMVFWWALFRQGLLRLVPVARGFVFDRVSDALVVIDREGRVLDLNAAAVGLARKLQPTLPDDLIGLPSHDLLPDGGDDDRLADGEHVIPLGERQIDLDVRSGGLTDRNGASIGRVVVVRDMTELNDKKRELAAANARLLQQLETIERLRADLAEQAVRDELTKLHNRRHLMRAFEADVALAEKTGRPLSVVLVDIDHFKGVNDRYGHGVGDDLLVAVAGVLSAATREGDTVARYGGEEFVVVLPGATQQQAWERAQEWRRRCAVTTVSTAEGPLSATFSAGVACFPDAGTSPTVLLNAADKALYRAKAEGRDRVLLADARAG